MRHEGRIAKKREVGYGWRLLYEDSGTRADIVRDAIQQRLTEQQPVGQRLEPMTSMEMRAQVEDAFLDVRERTMKAADPSADPKTYQLDLGLLLVGFDEDAEAAGWRFWPDGDFESIREVGYAAIGSGEDVANATLAHYGIPMSDPLDRVLYKAYEAKRRADKLITSVGPTTDLWIMTGQPDRRRMRPPAPPEDQPVVVPPRILSLLEEVFVWVSSAPWDRKPEPDYWSSPLLDYASAVNRGERPT